MKPPPSGWRRFLARLRQSVERLDVILSLNQDIWQSAFVPRLSGGLADRLSEVVVELDPLTEDGNGGACSIPGCPGLGARVLDRVDVGSAGTHARGLIRAAGMAWLKATAMDSQRPCRSPPRRIACRWRSRRWQYRPVACPDRSPWLRTPVEAPPVCDGSRPHSGDRISRGQRRNRHCQDWPAPESAPEPIMESRLDFADPGSGAGQDSPFSHEPPRNLPAVVRSSEPRQFPDRPAWIAVPDGLRAGGGHRAGPAAAAGPDAPRSESSRRFEIAPVRFPSPSPNRAFQPR